MKISMGNIKKVMHKSICYYLLFKTSFYINIIFKYLNITFASYIKCESFNTYNFGITNLSEINSSYLNKCHNISTVTNNNKNNK